MMIRQKPRKFSNTTTFAVAQPNMKPPFVYATKFSQANLAITDMQSIKEECNTIDMTGEAIKL